MMNHKKTYAVLDYDTFALFQTMMELTDSCKDVEFSLVENLSCRTTPMTPMIVALIWCKDIEFSLLRICPS